MSNSLYPEFLKLLYATESPRWLADVVGYLGKNNGSLLKIPAIEQTILVTALNAGNIDAASAILLISEDFTNSNPNYRHIDRTIWDHYAYARDAIYNCTKNNITKFSLRLLSQFFVPPLVALPQNATACVLPAWGMDATCKPRTNIDALRDYLEGLGFRKVGKADGEKSKHLKEILKSPDIQLDPSQKEIIQRKRELLMGMGLNGGATSRNWYELRELYRHVTMGTAPGMCPGEVSEFGTHNPAYHFARLYNTDLPYLDFVDQRTMNGFIKPNYDDETKQQSARARIKAMILAIEYPPSHLDEPPESVAAKYGFDEELLNYLHRFPQYKNASSFNDDRIPQTPLDIVLERGWSINGYPKIEKRPDLEEYVSVMAQTLESIELPREAIESILKSYSEELIKGVADHRIREIKRDLRRELDEIDRSSGVRSMVDTYPTDEEIRNAKDARRSLAERDCQSLENAGNHKLQRMLEAGRRALSRGGLLDGDQPAPPSTNQSRLKILLKHEGYLPGKLYSLGCRSYAEHRAGLEALKLLGEGFGRIPEEGILAFYERYGLKRDEASLNPLLIALRHGHQTEIKNVVSQTGSDYINAVTRNPEGRILLSNLMLAPDKETAEWLVGMGEQAGLTTNSEIPILTVAAQRGDMELLQYYLDMGCNLNATDHLGRTAIDCAISGQQYEAMLMLIRYGANLGTLTRRGAYDLVQLASKNVGWQEDVVRAVNNNNSVIYELLSRAEQYRLFNLGAINPFDHIMPYFGCPSAKALTHG